MPKFFTDLTFNSFILWNDFPLDDEIDGLMTGLFQAKVEELF